jgi:hypothetical protein
MKLVSHWLETAIQNLQKEQRSSSLYLLAFIVLIVAAGSLYMLVNSPA